MNKILSQTALCICLLGASGCTSLPKPGLGGDSSWSISSLWKEEYQSPRSLAVVWSPDILTVPGKPPTRGFGGRVFFYNEKSEAIPVEGDLVVHGYFGDPARGARDSKATKTFAFTAEQLTQHFSPSQLGASYSIWIPWDAAGGLQEQVTLLPTFRDKERGIVQGAPAKVMLPGENKEAALAERRKIPTHTVAYKSHRTPTNPGNKIPKIGGDMQVTTIALPKDASLAKPKSAKAFELNRSPQKIAPIQSNRKASGRGVGVGGGKSISNSKSTNAQKADPTKSVALPGIPIVNKVDSEPVSLDIDIEQLPKPGVYTLPPRAKARFAQENFMRISGMVRQASFAKPIEEQVESK